MIERLNKLRRFQKCLRRAAEASTPGESEAAEAAARRLMALYEIDPVKLTDKSLYDHTSFADNVLLIKLRQEHYETRRKKRKQQKRESKRPRLDWAAHDAIRQLLNDGLGNSEIETKLNHPPGTVNNVKYRHINKPSQSAIKALQYWIKDIQGKWQWAMRAQSAA